MRIHIPNSAFLGNIDSFLRGFDPANPNILELTANKSWIHVHPVVLTMLASLGLNVSRVVCEKIEARSGHYLERMGLFNALGVDSGIIVTEHEPSGRFIPLTFIKNPNELAGFIKEMIPLLHLEPRQAQPIQYIVSELVRNVLEHSQAEHGAVVAAQYFAKSNTIRIGITDVGVGIRRTISRSHKADSDTEALRLALTPGVTGTTPKEGGTEFNAGAGLFFIKSVANVNRGFFMIYSGSSMYKLLKRDSKSKHFALEADPFEDRHSKSSDLPYWQGTAVGIDIPLDTTEDFSKLLDLIRETYSHAVKARKKERYKGPQFI